MNDEKSLKELAREHVTQRLVHLAVDTGPITRDDNMTVDDRERVIKTLRETITRLESSPETIYGVSVCVLMGDPAEDGGTNVDTRTHVIGSVPFAAMQYAQTERIGVDALAKVTAHLMAGSMIDEVLKSATEAADHNGRPN